MVVISTQQVRPARPVTGQELEDLIASLGGHEAVREGIRWYGERCDLFDRRRDELTEKYPDQFVALAADDTIVASETLEGLFAEIDRLGLRRGDCVGEFLSSEPDWSSWPGASPPSLTRSTRTNATSGMSTTRISWCAGAA